MSASIDPSSIMRLNYARNTVDVDAGIAQLVQFNRQRNTPPIKAVIMVATSRPAAKFIERTRDVIPGLIYTNVSAVGGSALADELTLLGPRFANGVIVTQVVPPVEGYSSVVIDYKAALAKAFPDASPDYVSFEAYLETNILIEALRHAAQPLDTEKLVAALESLHDFDLGLGTPVSFGRTDHQAVHKVWATQLDGTGHYQPIDFE